MKRSELIRVRGLKVAYGRAEAVHGIDIDVMESSASVVLGANGAGKTSMLRGISGFENWEPGRVTAGIVDFGGMEVQGWSPARTARAGLRLVAERQSVFLQLTVSENLKLAMADGRRRKGFSEMSDLVLGMFPILSDRARQVAGLLSGGERQMLGIAARLLAMPSAILLDEVSFGLAPAIIGEIFRALAEIKAASGITMLLVEQNIDAALGIADYVYLVQGGRIVSHGLTAEMRDSKGIYEQYVGSGSVPRG
jgi:branched-chain amino acid transport system ATP-binding protein